MATKTSNKPTTHTEPAPKREVIPDYDQLSAEDAAELNAKFGDIRSEALAIEAQHTALKSGLKCPNRMLKPASLLNRAELLRSHADTLCRMLGEFYTH